MTNPTTREKVASLIDDHISKWGTATEGVPLADRILAIVEADARERPVGAGYTSAEVAERERRAFENGWTVLRRAVECIEHMRHGVRDEDAETKVLAACRDVPGEP